MADLTLRIRGDVDAKDLIGLSGTAEELTQQLKELEAAADDLSGKRIGINIDTTTKGSGKIREVVELTEELDRETLKLQKSIKKATNAEQGSVASSRALVATLTQQKNAVQTGSKEWGFLSQRLEAANRAYRKAQGIQQGSAADIQRQISFFKDLQSTTRQTGGETNKYADAIRKLSADLRQQQGIQQGSKADLEAIKRELYAARDATNAFANPAKFQELSQSINQVESELSQLESPFKKLARFVDTIGRIRVAIDAVSDAFRLVNGTINTFVTRTKQIEGFTLALQNIGYSASEANDALEQSARTALDLGAPLAGVERSYKRMIPSLQSLGVESRDSDRFIENLAARTQTLGLNTEESGRLVEAFAQVLSKGKLSSEELNQQISELDGAFRTQLADALGVSNQELVKLIESGNVGSKDFVQAFLKMENGVDLLKKRMETGNATIQQLQNNISTLNTKNIEAVGQAFDPLFRALLRVQLELTKLFAALAKSDALKALGQISADVVEGFTYLTTQLIKLAGIALQILEPLFQLANAIARVDFFGIRLGHVLGALLAIFVQNAIVGVFKNQILGLGKASQGAVGFVIKLASQLGGLKGIIATIKTQGLINGLLNLSRGAVSFTGSNVVQYFTRFGGILKGTGGLVTKLAVGMTSFGGIVATVAGLFSYAMVKGFLAAKKGADNVAPGIKLVEEKLSELQGKTVELDSTKAEGFFEGIYRWVKEISPELGKLVDDLKWLWERFKQLFPAMRASEFAATKLNEAVEKFGRDSNIIGFTNNLSLMGDGINRARAEANKYGGVLTKNSDLTKINTKDLKEQIKVTKNVIELEKEYVKSIERQIADMKKSNPEMVREIQNLENLKKVTQTQISQSEQLLKRLEAETAARAKNNDVVAIANERLEALGKATKKASQSKDILNATVEARSYQELADGIITAEQAEAKRLTANLMGINGYLKALNTEKNELARVAQSAQGLTDEQRTRYEELQTLTAQTASEQQQAYNAVQDAIVEAFARGIEEAQKLADIALAAASRVKTAFDGIATAGTSGIQAGLQLIETLSDATLAAIDREEKKKLEAAEKSGLRGIALEKEKERISKDAEREKETVLAAELALRRDMANVEYQIESIRLAVATRVKIAEAQALQARLKGEAAVARARGDGDAAEQLEIAAALQDVVIRGAEIEHGLQQEILGFRLDQKQAAIGAEAAANNIAGFSMPGMQTATNNLNSFAQRAKSATAEFGRMADKAAQTGKKINDENMKKGLDKANDTTKAISATARAANAFGEGMESVARYFTIANSQANRLLGTVRNISNAAGISARAMGGPVEAGSQYLVNDGGGREAFINSFGRMSMLPAGRNIKWTAPTSGMVIPAHLVDDFRSRLMAREKIDNYKSYQQPQQPVSRNIIRSTSSKSVANSSSSQRIVNHVTIQSQSPVADASRLMANVSKLKSRRRI